MEVVDKKERKIVLLKQTDANKQIEGNGRIHGDREIERNTKSVFSALANHPWPLSDVVIQDCPVYNTDVHMIGRNILRLDDIILFIWRMPHFYDLIRQLH